MLKYLSHTQRENIKYILFHAQTYAFSGNIDVCHCHFHLLIQFHYLVRLGDVAVRHLADVHETVLVHANIHETAKCGDVCNYAGKLHTLP